MDKKNRISVIVPIYNVEKYLDRCINSILNQSFKDIELILVDDGSPDNCPVICDNYEKKDSRIKVIHKKNEGLGLARNSGLQIATGKYVYFVDSDDYLDDNCLQILYETIENEKSDICFGGIRMISEKGEFLGIENSYGNVSFLNSEILDKVLLEMLGSNPIQKRDSLVRMSVWQGLYNRDLIVNNNVVFPSERQFISEDIIFHLHLLPFAEKITYIANSVYVHVVDNVDSLTHKYNPDRFLKDIILYEEEVNIISTINGIDNEKFILRSQRMLLANTRVCLKQIISNSRHIGKKMFNKAVDEIINNQTLQKVLSKYPIRKNPFKQFLSSFLIKHRLKYLLVALVRFDVFLRRK